MANQFAQRGWDVTVITCQREFFRDYIKSYDPSLEDSLHEHVAVERVDYDGYRWEPDLRQYGWLRGHFPAYADRIYTKFEQLLFPDKYSTWIPPVVRRGLALHRRKPVDIILATGNPFASFGAARWLSKLIKRPYAIDYRDSWTLNQFTEEPAFPAEHIVWNHERKLISDASRVLFVNEPQREWYSSMYPDSAEQMLVVENGYDPEFLVPRGQAELKGRPLTFGYLGTITDQLPLADFLEGWKSARQSIPMVRDARTVFFGHLGFFPNQRKGLLGRLNQYSDSGVLYSGPVEKSEVADTYSKIDVLLALIPSSRFVTAGKIYEYMATGKPILAVFDPKTDTAAALKGYPACVMVDRLSPSAVRDALSQITAKFEGLKSPATIDAGLAHAARYSRDQVLSALVDDFERLVSRE